MNVNFAQLSIIALVVLCLQRPVPLVNFLCLDPQE